MAEKLPPLSIFNDASMQFLCICTNSIMFFLSLQDNFDEYDDDEENCYIPQEVVLEYQCQREKVEQQRRKLRETLKENFARLCKQHKNNNKRNIKAAKSSTSGTDCI